MAWHRQVKLAGSESVREVLAKFFTVRVTVSATHTSWVRSRAMFENERRRHSIKMPTTPFKGSGGRAGGGESGLHHQARTRSFSSGGDARRGMESPENIVILGGGSLGSLFAGRLGALKGMEQRVWMLTSWQEQAQAVHDNCGIIVQEEGSVGRKCLIGDVRVARSLTEIRKMQIDSQNAVTRGKVNVVIIAVKHPTIRKAANEAAQILSGTHGGVCITLLNGLGHIEVVRNAFRNHDTFATILHGVFTGGARMETAGVVKHVGQGVLSLAVANRVHGILLLCSLALTVQNYKY